MTTIEEESQTVARVFERRYDLDWLRIIGILLVFIFHCARFFDTLDWHIKNNWPLDVPLSEQSEGMTTFIYYLGGPGMPLFFMIAGMVTFYALRNVKGGLYALDRVIRLLVPFVIGLFTHIPLQIYLERVSHGDFTGTFSEFYRQMFNGRYGFGGDFDYFGLHLWFLLVLCFISLITLPLTIYYSKDKNLVKLDRFTNILNKPVMIFLFPIPIIIFELVNALTGGHIFVFGAWTVISYLIYFIYGYLIATNIKFKNTIEKHAIAALIVVLISGVFLFFLPKFNIDENIKNLLFLFVAVYYSWCVLISLFALGSKFLNRDNKARKFMNELVMPFYVIHQTIIVVIGFFIVQLNMYFLVKYLIIIVTSFTACVILLMPIKYLNPLRVIFGMRWKRGLLKRNKENF
ncbi:MAG: acyltransferase [Asgard group archaeon]|nr:acyltransferase [Asgard group archaeon]